MLSHHFLNFHNNMTEFLYCIAGKERVKNYQLPCPFLMRWLIYLNLHLCSTLFFFFQLYNFLYTQNCSDHFECYILPFSIQHILSHYLIINSKGKISSTRGSKEGQTHRTVYPTLLTQLFIPHYWLSYSSNTLLTELFQPGLYQMFYYYQQWDCRKNLPLIHMFPWWNTNYHVYLSLLDSLLTGIREKVTWFTHKLNLYAHTQHDIKDLK